MLLTRKPRVCTAFDTMDQQILPKKKHAFVVAFEPLVDKWALMLARNVRSRVAGSLGWHNERGVILPFAVSDRAGVVPFYVSPRDGCSSLNRVHAPKHGGWRTNAFVRQACARTVHIRQVPAVTLETILRDWLPGWHVKRLKIDAQGSDMGVLAAAGTPQLRRIGEVAMETLNDDCDSLYEGQPNCSTVLRSMYSLGFAPDGGFSCSKKSAFTQGSGCEANVLFHNVRWPVIPPATNPPAGEERQADAAPATAAGAGARSGKRAGRGSGGASGKRAGRGRGR